MSESILIAIIGCASSLLGALIGGYISHRTIKVQEHSRLLSECYAVVFDNYYRCINDKSQENRIKLIASIEKTKLFCSKHSYDALTKLGLAALSDNRDLGTYIDQVRSCARKELKKK